MSAEQLGAGVLLYRVGPRVISLGHADDFGYFRVGQSVGGSFGHPRDIARLPVLGLGAACQRLELAPRAPWNSPLSSLCEFGRWLQLRMPHTRSTTVVSSVRIFADARLVYRLFDISKKAYIAAVLLDVAEGVRI